MHRDQSCQNLDNAPGADRARNVDGQALPGELVDDRQAFQLLATSASIEHEVVGPDVVGGTRRQRPRARTGNPSSRPSTRKLQPGKAPQAQRPVPTHVMTLSSKKHANPPVAITRILCRQSLHRLDHGRSRSARTEQWPKPDRATSISSQARRCDNPRVQAKATCSRRADELTIFFD